MIFIFKLLADNSLSESVKDSPKTIRTSGSNTLYYTAVESPSVPSPSNGKLEGIAELAASSAEPPMRRPACLNRSSLHQSILRKSGVIRSSVRRHSSMVASFPYDISSLDHGDMLRRGISIRQLNPTRGSSITNGSSKSASSSPVMEFPIVMSSVMQETQAAALSDRQVGLDGLHFAKVAIGPRGVLPWKPLELAHRLEIFNGNEFGLTARMVSYLCFF